MHVPLTLPLVLTRSSCQPIVHSRSISPAQESRLSSHRLQIVRFKGENMDSFCVDLGSSRNLKQRCSMYAFMPTLWFLTRMEIA